MLGICLPIAPLPQITLSSCKMSHPQLSKMSLCSYCVKPSPHLDVTEQRWSDSKASLIKWRKASFLNITQSRFSYGNIQHPATASHEENVTKHILCLGRQAVMAVVGMAWEVGGGEVSVTVTVTDIVTPVIISTQLWAPKVLKSNGKIPSDILDTPVLRSVSRVWFFVFSSELLVYLGAKNWKLQTGLKMKRGLRMWHLEVSGIVQINLGFIFQTVCQM